MELTILRFLHHASILLFGVFVSAAFLGIRMNRKNRWILLLFSAAAGVINALCYFGFGEAMTEKLYPLIIHLPLILFFVFFYRFRFSASALAVLTAYLCCQISNWTGLALLNLTQLEWVYYAVRIAVTVGTFVFLLLFVADAMAALLRKSTGSILILGLMPFVYYLYDYTVNVYTDLLASGMESVVEFLGFVLCMAYLLFLFLYFRQYEAEQEAQQRGQLLEMKRVQAEKELAAIRRSELATSILRHDMRHFLAQISGYLEKGEVSRAQDFIREITQASDRQAPRKYSKNELVNTVLSAQEETIQKNGIDFQTTVELPEELPFSEVDLMAILSNALENAVRAAAAMPEGERLVRLDLRLRDGKLLLSLKNTFAHAPRFLDGLPQAEEAGHGVGVQSIRYAAERLGGNCQFAVAGNWFVLQVIL